MSWSVKVRQQKWPQKEGQWEISEGDNREARNKELSSEETAEQCGNIRRWKVDGAEEVPGIEAQAFNQSTWDIEAGDQEFRASLAYTGCLCLKTA